MSQPRTDSACWWLIYHLSSVPVLLGELTAAVGMYLMLDGLIQVLLADRTEPETAYVANVAPRLVGRS